jgi:N-methylhydantoinase A
VWSAIGLLEAEMEHHLVRTFLRPLAGLAPGELAAAVAALEGEAAALLAAQGHSDVEITRAADLKYQGQSFELTIPVAADTSHGEIAAAFAREHERTYGHKAEGDPIQVVNLRLTARVRRAERPDIALDDAATAPGGTRRAYFGPAHGTVETPVLARADLGKKPRVGPLLIDEYDATTLVPPGCRAHLDRHGNIVIETAARGRRA